MHTLRINRMPLCFAAGFCLCIAVGQAQAQWVPPRGEGTIALEYQFFSNTDHLLSDISNARWQISPDRHDITDVSGSIVSLSVDYAVYDRLALSVALPFVNTDLEAGTAHSGSHSVDHEPNSAFQDIGASLRYMVLTDPLFVTTSLGVVIPTHNYGTHGHAAVGRNLNVLSLGIGAARMLNPIVSGVYLQGSYNYSFTEEVFGLNMNRSNFSVGATYFPSLRVLSDRSFAVSAYWSQQITHGGVDWSDPGFETNPQWGPQHDRIAAENFGQIGGTVAFSLTGYLGIYAGYYQTVESVSQNTQRLKGLILGTSTSF